MSETKKLPPFGLVPSVILFGGAGLFLYLETNFLIPWLTENTGIETIIWWFIVAGFGMFIPLLLISGLILNKEGCLFKSGMWKTRLRFQPMNKQDWYWTLIAFIAIGGLSYFIMFLIENISGAVDHQPPFMQFEPLDSGRYWILAIWFPYWLFNILGEEILWRGVILPRQEVSFGKYAWLINGLGWGFFHIAFGWQLLVTLLPILFILGYVVQRRKNTWIGVILHAGLNGPSFIAISLGMI